MRSSYRKNKYNLLFTSLIKIYRPKTIVECGVLDGYSLMALAKSAKKINSRVYGIDLFESYEFKHCSYHKINQLCIDNKVEDIVTLIRADAILSAKDFTVRSIDFLHIDISNTCDNLYQMFEAWLPKLSANAIIVFEGGSLERDNVEWMIKYNKNPIFNFKTYLKENNFEYFTFDPYPSITICKRG